MGLGFCVSGIVSDLVGAWIKLGTLSGLQELFSFMVKMGWDRHTVNRA